MRRGLKRRVRLRALGRCEYCKLPEACDVIPFQFDHIVARQHRGTTTFNNLALCCSYCNAHKGPNLAGIDPKSRNVVTLFHPRRDRWERHFRWNGARLIGLTEKGRATINVLKINSSVNVAVRTSLIAEGVFYT